MTYFMTRNMLRRLNETLSPFHQGPIRLSETPLGRGQDPPAAPSPISRLTVRASRTAMTMRPRAAWPCASHPFSLATLSTEGTCSPLPTWERKSGSRATSQTRVYDKAISAGAMPAPISAPERVAGSHVTGVRIVRLRLRAPIRQQARKVTDRPITAAQAWNAMGNGSAKTKTALGGGRS